MSEWAWVPAGEVCHQRKDTLVLEPGIEYRTMGVRWHGRGAYDRGSGTTETIKAKRLFRAHEGDFVFNRIDTQNGAFDVVPVELHGALATNEFPLYVADESRLLAHFLLLYFQQESVLSQIDSVRAGSEGRSRWKEADFEAWRIPLPSLGEQRRINNVVAAVDGQLQGVADEIGRADALYDAATSTLWLDYAGSEAMMRPLDDVMHVDIQRIPMEPTQTYRSAGVLNAGQGLIDKGPFRGSDTEYRTMNRLRTNQVVMRKLTAWEGPITVVPSAFDGYVASTEFPTFTLSADVAPEWMRHVCRTRRLWHEMKNRVTGSVQRRKRLNPDQLLSVALPVPPRDAQEQSAAALDSLDAEITALRRELAHLRSFRSVLLTALLNQEIEIPESYDRLLEQVS